MQQLRESLFFPVPTTLTLVLGYAEAGRSDACSYQRLPILFEGAGNRGWGHYCLATTAVDSLLPRTLVRPQLLRHLCLYGNTRTRISSCSFLLFLFALIALFHHFKASVHSREAHYHKFFPCLHLFTHFPIKEDINNSRTGLDSVHVLIMIYTYWGF